MKRFSQLITALEQTTKTTLKVDALEAYLRDASESDRLWCLALFMGRRPKRSVSTTVLREWASEVSGLPLWLLEETYAVVGDLAETIALILPQDGGQASDPLSDIIHQIQGISNFNINDKKEFVLSSWARFSGHERFVFNKLLTGGFRVGVSQKLMARAVSLVVDKPETEIAHRLMGAWDPNQNTWYDLIEAEGLGADQSRPYPFCLAHAVEGEPSELGEVSDWHAEWKWDGIRGQIVVRGGACYVWSRGEELVTDRFPEFARLSADLPDGTVLDGEIIGWVGEKPLPFNALQKRIGRKKVPKSLLSEVPVILYAYDLLEWQGQDMRKAPLIERRAILDHLCTQQSKAVPLRLSPVIECKTWQELSAKRSDARSELAEGVMLKHTSSDYKVGRKKGAWWKWKLDPLTIDAVMIYAQAGHGRRANLYTDFTFAVWNGNELVPFTKAYSGLTDAEFGEITRWVRKNTQERFGPVRQVTPHHVFEIAFEGIHESPRHKSGVALRFPRMARWRHDKAASEANTLTDLKEMLTIYG